MVLKFELEEDLVIDIDKNKNLVALQIFYANEFFKALDKDFPKNILNEIKEVNVDFVNYRNYMIIKLLLHYKQKIIEEKLPPIPMKKYESPIVNYIK